MADKEAAQGGQGESSGASSDIQGNHEQEQSSWDQCEKNPGHESFIPVSDFTLEHIPMPYRNDIFYKFILAMASLTARLCGKYISPARPEEYVFSKYRGQKVSYMGSGYVIETREDTRVSTQCQCPECMKSPNNTQKRWIVILRTAAHLIFDSKEAEKTTVDLFYDNKHKREDMRTLYGVGVIEASVPEDISKIECVTHDESTYRRLKANLDEFSQLRIKLSTSRGTFINPSIEVIVSHPHGSSKQISFKETEKVPTIYDSIPLLLLLGMKSAGLPVPPLQIAVPMYGTRLGLVGSVKSPDNLKADGTEEAEMMNIEIKVEFPDGEISHHNIWMLRERVKKSKEFLLRAGGIKDQPSEEFVMILKMAQTEDVTMDDDKIMMDYIGDLTEASCVKIKSKMSFQV